MSLAQLQNELRPWVQHNFPDRPAHQPLLGVMEELGELAHSHLKEEQRIRVSENHVRKIKDAIGDICIFLADYCNARGFDMDDIVMDVWEEVQKRDWIKYPINGLTE